MIAPIRGRITVCGDKSITHRAILFGSIADGTSVIRTAALGRDNLASVRVMQQLGVRIHGELTADILHLGAEEGLKECTLAVGAENLLIVTGRGKQSLLAPASKLDCGNSGTTARLLLGILAGCSFEATLIGDESLSRRPFGRVAAPLRKLGAEVSGDTLPLKIRGGTLRSIEYDLPQASAQVKSALLLAGMFTAGGVSISEPHRSRDHSERMLQSMGASLDERQENGRWRVTLHAPQRELRPVMVTVPGDFSAAAFFLVAASVVPGSLLEINGVGCNPTRLGALDVLRRMGARIEMKTLRVEAGEPVARFIVESAALTGTEIGGEDALRAIDEIPALAVAAAFASGETVIRDAAELRVKESDRIRSLCGLLEEFGVRVQELDDGLVIWGGTTRASGSNRQFETLDHRVAMSRTLLSYLTTGVVMSFEKGAVETSFPGFAKLLQVVTSKAEDG